MRTKIVLAVLCLLALTVAVGFAETVKITEGNYADLGWVKTLKTGPEPGQAVNFEMRTTTTPPGVPGIQCSPKRSALSNFAWAGLSTNLFEGRLLSTVTYFRIRTNGFEGDGTAWEPPSVYLQGSWDGTNQRNIRFLPYASYGRGTSWTFYEYDLMGANSKWFCMIDAVVRTWADVLAAWPQWQFDSTVFANALPSGQTFNCFNGSAINQDVVYGSSARGMIDWVEIGFNDGTHFKFDFDVPTFLLNNKAAKDSVVGLKKATTCFVVFGTVLADPAADSFYIDDGSGATIKVLAVGHGRNAGQYVRASGYLNNETTPAELSCDPASIVSLYP